MTLDEMASLRNDIALNFHTQIYFSLLSFQASKFEFQKALLKMILRCKNDFFQIKNGHCKLFFFWIGLLLNEPTKHNILCIPVGAVTFKKVTLRKIILNRMTKAWNLSTE
jgi:hypothetical protein